MRDNKRREPKQQAGRSTRPSGRRWTPEMVAKLTSNDIACLSLADAAALLTMRKEGPASCSEIGKAQELVDAYCRLGADLLLQIDALPRGHLERRAAVARLRAVRPYALQAMDELRYLQIRDALRLRNTPIANMGRG